MIKRRSEAPWVRGWHGIKKKRGLKGLGNKIWPLMKPHLIYSEENMGPTYPALTGLPTSPGTEETIPVCSLIGLLVLPIHHTEYTQNTNSVIPFSFQDHELRIDGLPGLSNSYSYHRTPGSAHTE